MYTRPEVEEIATAAVREALRAFDERRNATVDELVDYIGRVRETPLGPVRAGEEFPTIGYPRSDRLPG
jgi:hypothetical protein